MQLAHETLKSAGFPQTQGGRGRLNPHAGDGGTIVERRSGHYSSCRRESSGEADRVCWTAFPSDTLYLKVRDGEYDCAVSMYHDQGQIALKLLGFKMGVSVHSGLPFPMGTPAHGTAFDIAGQNLADIEPATSCPDGYDDGGVESGRGLTAKLKIRRLSRLPFGRLQGSGF